MKKKNATALLICAAVTVLAAGCGDDKVSKNPTVSSTIDVQSVLDQGMKEQSLPESLSESSPEDIQAEKVQKDDITEEESEYNGVIETEEVPKKAEGIDVDLTVLSATMVYSEVFNMMYYPENYIGKTVKMNGAYSVFHDEVTDKYYHGCIIKDATACCSQGIEFELAGDHKYPDDYPEEGSSVCVSGVFETYQEGENTFCTLRNARFEN